MEKTNVMRILDQKKIAYQVYEYPHEDGICVEGIEVAKLLNQNPDQVFKTLVTVSSSKHYYVFVLPVSQELDLKLAAKAVKEKAVSMLPLKDLLNVTGYIRGGCSPIGMKKAYKTIFDVRALDFEQIIFSAGKIGYQVEIAVNDLTKLGLVGFASIVH